MDLCAPMNEFIVHSLLDNLVHWDRERLAEMRKVLGVREVFLEHACRLQPDILVPIYPEVGDRSLP